MAFTITPSDKLQFSLRNSADADAAPKTTMELRNDTSETLAYKVKTTQPRRYLVRPNQGIVAPGTSSSITIILVSNHVKSLLSDYSAMGPSAIQSNKDKFLVQSYPLSPTGEFSSLVENHSKLSSKDSAAELTQLWKTVGESPERKDQISNKKLHVEHIVETEGGADEKEGVGGYGAVGDGGNRIKEGLKGGSASGGEGGAVDFQEVANLRKKYDELVQFSVSLTAERDFLNNSLEQAKRDLNREMAARMTAEDASIRGEGVRQRKGGAAGSPGKEAATAGSVQQVKKGFSFLQLMIIAVIMFFAGKMMK